MRQLVQVDKLRELANFLREVPPSQFDLREWEVRQEVPAKTIFFGLIETQPACGFAGCAMGWAAHSEKFGMYIDDGDIVYNGDIGWKAVCQVFGITELVAMHLFSESRYAGTATPGEVASRVNKYANQVEVSRLRKRTIKPVAEPEVIALQKQKVVA